MKMKRFTALNLSLFLILGTTVPIEPAEAFVSYGAGLPITAGSAILLDAKTQKVIFAKSPHSRRPPASTTKIMTALVVLEKVSPQRIVRIPRWVKSIEPSKAYLRPGERYRVRDLIHALLISSANDAAEVLAVAAAGSRWKFAQWMNAQARWIGCRNTHFANPSGLPDSRQYSTTYDLALIMKEARKNPLIIDSLSRKYHTIQSLEGRRIPLRNHNRLLWRDPRSVIGKTGYTRKGRHCFVGRIQWKGREVLISLLGSNRLWQDLKVLMDYQFGVVLYKVHKNKKRWSKTQTYQIQQALIRAGYSPGKVDGVFGPKTIQAIELFQKNLGVKPDGIIGPFTCKKLTRYSLPQSVCR